MRWRGGGTQRDRKESREKRQGRKQDRSDKSVGLRQERRGDRKQHRVREKDEI